MFLFIKEQKPRGTFASLHGLDAWSIPNIGVNYSKYCLRRLWIRLRFGIYNRFIKNYLPFWKIFQVFGKPRSQNAGWKPINQVKNTVPRFYPAIICPSNMSSSSSCDTCCTSGNVKINIKLFHFDNGVSICGFRSTTGVRQGQGQIRTDYNRPITVFQKLSHLNRPKNEINNRN